MRAAVVQLNSTEDTERNLERADSLTREAISLGAELVLLPEKWTVLGTAEHLRAGAQSLDGPAIRWARALAREHGIDLIAGSIVERCPDGGQRNTSVHLGPGGEITAAYSKLHLFDVEVDGVRYAESDTESPGDHLALSELADGTPVGLTVCYDLRFPELYGALAAHGAEILTVPSAFTLATTRDHWEVLLRARAIENSAYVLAANQIGTHAPANRSGGRSMIVDPWGVVLAAVPDREGVAMADLDRAAVQGVRRRLPSLAHRHDFDYAALV
jgi:predicted amidohydrolase